MTTRSRSTSKAGVADTSPQFLRLGSVERFTGLARSTIFRLVALKDFPAPVRVGVRAIAWRRADLEQWSESRQTVSQ